MQKFSRRSFLNAFIAEAPSMDEGDFVSDLAELLLQKSDGTKFRDADIQYIA